jgi:MFS family permease
MFTSLTTLPLFLSADPFNYNDAVVGLCYLPVGAAMFLGAVYGGAYSDKAALHFPHVTEGRLMYSIIPMWMVCFGSIGFGFSVSYFHSFVGALASQFVLGFGQAWLMPSTLGYLSAARPLSSGAVGSVMFFLCFVGAAVCISVSIIISNLIGYSLFFLGLGVLSGAATLWLTLVTLYKVKKYTLDSSSYPVSGFNSSEHKELISPLCEDEREP